MKYWNIAVLILLPIAFLAVIVSDAYSASIDAYVVYSGKDKHLKSSIIGALPKGVSVKAYNVDLLGVADYSGVQKAGSKIDQAATIIFIGDTATKYFKDRTLHANLIVVNGTQAIKKPRGSLVYLVGEDLDSNKLKEMTTERIESEQALIESTAQALLINDSILTFPRAVGLLLKKSVVPRD